MKTSLINIIPTKGPWSVAPNGHCVFTDALTEGRGIAMCGMTARTPEEIADNTQLIAAAPDLLKQLKKANDLLRSTHAIAARDGTQTNWEAFRAQLDAALEEQHALLWVAE